MNQPQVQTEINNSPAPVKGGNNALTIVVVIVILVIAAFLLWRYLPANEEVMEEGTTEEVTTPVAGVEAPAVVEVEVVQ